MTGYIPKPGDIGLTRIAGPVGAGIRFGQWLYGDGFADYEHAFVVVQPSPSNIVMIVEARPGGAEHVPLHYDPAQTVYLRCPDRLRAGVAAAALAYTDVPYSFLDYQALALHHFHVPAPGLRRYIASSGHMICSQLADRAAADADWHLFADGRWNGYVTPGDIHHLYLEQQGAAA